MTGEIMKGIKIDQYTAKEAMERVVEYMKIESVQTIEMVTLDTLRCYSKELEWNDNAFNLTLADSRVVLEAVGIKDERLLKEADAHLFMKMFVRFLHKNRVKVFLLAENDEVLSNLKEWIKENYTKIVIVETATLEEHGVSDDMLLNRINGVEAECVLTALPSPKQQEFIAKNRMLMNARIWVGLGVKIGKKEKKKSLFHSVKEVMFQYLKKE